MRLMLMCYVWAKFFACNQSCEMYRNYESIYSCNEVELNCLHQFFEHTISCWCTPTELWGHPQQRVLLAFSKRFGLEPATESSIYWHGRVSQYCNMIDICPNANERYTKNPVAVQNEVTKSQPQDPMFTILTA